MASTFPHKSLQERFWSNVNITDLFECWNWIGDINNLGYGRLSFKGQRTKAHRLSYTLNIGPILGNLFVCHKCNNPSCVNPSHLYLGTSQDNMTDKVKANRQSHASSPGEKNGMSVLTESQVIEIIGLLKTANMTQKEIAKKYSTGRSAISHINLNNTWTYLPRPQILLDKIANKGPLKGENHPHAKLTETQVVEIIRLLKTKSMKQQDIADRFSTSFQNISAIKMGHKWKYLQR
jgi:predicted XRE-type DNA-binding protein